MAVLCRVLAEGCIQIYGSTNKTQAVRSEYPYLVTACHVDYRFFKRGATAVTFTESGGNDDCRTDALFTTGMDDVRYNGRRRCNNRKVYRFSDGFDGWIAVLLEQMLVLRIDCIQLAGKIALQKVAEYPATDRVMAFAGAENSNCTWSEKTIKKVRSHINFSGSLLLSSFPVLAKAGPGNGTLHDHSIYITLGLRAAGLGEHPPECPERLAAIEVRCYRAVCISRCGITLHHW